ncbi:alpha/beta hydrolase [Chloroflexus islandicus]|uniref:Alpha/beta hydrolase n=1 Tax=Chloroflexus islandicus TaxID=1707952 RepID=A0A178MGB5_9CHLR|nr:alpha/beta fold hydrolase [Chloroflexus islandicus]OAN47603.1 alpha/beta hydrolase [Chloroflexus islandicus]
MATTLTDPQATRRFEIREEYRSGPDGLMRAWISSPQQGLPVLLIHGYGALIEHWRPVMRPIASEHTLYAIDLYNFGYSARPAGRPSRERWAAQAAAFIRDTIGQPAVVVGHSMGGVVSAQLARAYPDLVKALVLVNSSGAQLQARPLSPIDRLMLNAIGAPLVGEALAGVFGNRWGVRQGLLSAYHRKECVTPELVETFSGPLRRYGAGSYLKVSREFANLVLDLTPGEIQMPTLLIWGAEDQSIPPAHAEIIKNRMIPHAEIKIIPDSGHCPFDETPQAFLDILLPWLRHLPA